MIANTPRAMFVNADPVAVFAVLADLKHRHQIIETVTAVELLTPSPVREGTLFRETRKGVFSPSRTQRVDTFSPPRTMTFSRNAFGIRTQIALHLEEKVGGTNLIMDLSGSAVWLPASLPNYLVNRWARQMENDLDDIRRHVEPRANPNWRPGIARNNAPPPAD